MDKGNIPGYENYYLSAEGNLYNIKTGKQLKHNNYSFTLVSAEGKRKKISIKNLYKQAYNKVFAFDTIEDFEGEQWKEVKEAQGNYFCSNLGRIKSYCNNQAIIMKPYYTNNYAKLKLVFYGKITTCCLHRIVGLHWLEAPKSADCIIHHLDRKHF